MNRPRSAFLVVASSLIVLDQVVKSASRAAAEGVEGRVFAVVWPRVLELKLVYNEGVAFGLLQGAGILLAPVALAIAFFCFRAVWRVPPIPISHAVVAGTLTAGAIGNLIDRVVSGKVTDMVYVRAINFPVFNLSDACISVAGVLLVAGSIFGQDRKVIPTTEAATQGEPAP